MSVKRPDLLIKLSKNDQSGCSFVLDEVEWSKKGLPNLRSTDQLIMKENEKGKWNPSLIVSVRPVGSGRGVDRLWPESHDLRIECRNKSPLVLHSPISASPTVLNFKPGRVVLKCTLRNPTRRLMCHGIAKKEWENWKENPSAALTT